MTNNPPFVCSICGRDIVGEFSNNAQPVNNGRCCKDCDDRIVIPHRIRDIERAKRQQR